MHRIRFTTQSVLEPRLAPSATLVRDINPDISSSIFGFDAIANVGGVLQFVANDGVNGPEL
jgi:hypothetical protein